MPTQLKTEKVIRRNFGSPDEARNLGHGRMEQVRIGRNVFSRFTLEPGWKWSRDIKPLVKTDSCQAAHVQYILSGRLMIQMDDGTRTELAGGDAAVIPPGHDAWVVGDQPVIVIDFASDKNDYALAEPDITSFGELNC